VGAPCPREIALGAKQLEQSSSALSSKDARMVQLAGVIAKREHMLASLAAEAPQATHALGAEQATVSSRAAQLDEEMAAVRRGRATLATLEARGLLDLASALGALVSGRATTRAASLPASRDAFLEFAGEAANSAGCTN
jgi:hypothetical protein